MQAGPQNLSAALPDLQRAVELLPETDPLAPFVAMTIGALRHDRSVAEGSLADGVETMLSGLLDEDPDRVADGSARLTDPSMAAAFSGAQRVSWLEIAAVANQVRFDQTGDPAELDAAISSLCEARARLADDDGNPQVADVLKRLGTLYVRRAADRADAARASDQDSAIAAGLRGLRAHATSALLQDTPAQALVAVEAAAGDAQRVAAWCLDADRPTDAVTAVELGRGVVLHAAASATRVATMLHEAGHAALADEWQTSGVD